MKKPTTGKGSGQRRRYGGKTGLRVRTMKGYKIVPRSQGSSGSKARVSYEMGSTSGKTVYATKELPGRFKVSLPRNLTRGDSGALTGAKPITTNDEVAT